ncbi:MAG: DNA polymerase I [Pseudomonadales bacterium]
MESLRLGIADEHTGKGPESRFEESEVTHDAETTAAAISAPVVLVDGSSYLFRAFHALPDLRTSDGFPTGAVRGVIAMLRKLMRDYPESPVTVIFDARGKTFREALYPEYKAHRPPMPEDLARQIEPIHAIVRAMGLPLLIIPGVEADDVIGTLAAQATAEARDTVISTSDKDMAQLVSAHVTLVNTMTDTRTDRAGVIERFGVPPERIIDYLALMGDSVDNIPGVPKVGPKTAARWLNDFGDLDSIMARADEVGGKVGESLRGALAQLPLSRTLATIRCDVELQVGIHDLELSAADFETLREWFKRLEFRAWSEELSTPTSVVTARTTASVSTLRDYRTVDTPDALASMLEELRRAPLCAVDTETTSLRYMEARLVGLSFSVEPGRAWYVPIGHQYLGVGPQLPFDETLAELKPFLEDATPRKVGQNLKYDVSVLAEHGIALRGIAHDTMLESYVLDSTAGRHNLDDLAKRVLGTHTITFEEVAGKGAQQIGFESVSIDQATTYAAEDADIALQLHAALWSKLGADNRLRSVYTELELPLINVLSRIERTGALVDGPALNALSAELAVRIAALRERACEVAGEAFNPDSPKQLQAILYDKQQLPVLSKTPKGQPSTAEAALEILAEDYELPRLILEYRGLAKLRSTYAERLPAEINARTGRIHTSYHQAVTATGRLSSSDPNLQNIPVRTAEGRRIRQAFIAPPGRRILAADYSQIELRIMAHLSADEGLLQAFAAGQDIHRRTAAEVFNESLDAVSDEQRRSAKAINFGLIYGMSAFGLAKQLGVSRTLAQDYINRYFARYPGVRDYMERTRAQAREQGYVETLFGRRLHVPEILAGNQARRQAAERTAINAPMQGSAADIIKRAMIDVDQWLQASRIDALMIMQVHDELVFEVAESALGTVAEQVSAIMSGAAQLQVPLVVDVGVGSNWDEAH